MGLNASAYQAGVNGMTAAITSVSLHTADPGTTGANEASGGSPAYARKTPAWGSAAAAGSGAYAGITAALVFNVYNQVITHVGFWAGSTFRGFQALPTPRDFTGVQDTLSISTLTISQP